MLPLPSEHIQTCVKPGSTLRSGRRVTLAKGIAGWISGPRKTFLLIQKFRKDAKDHISFPTETRFLPGAHSWKLERGGPVQSSPDLCQGGTHTAGPPGEGREVIQTLSTRDDSGVCAHGITERISPHAGFRGGGPPVKFMDIIWADIRYRNRKPQRLHTAPKNKKQSFLG